MLALKHFHRILLFVFKHFVVNGSFKDEGFKGRHLVSFCEAW